MESLRSEASEAEGALLCTSDGLRMGFAAREEKIAALRTELTEQDQRSRSMQVAVVAQDQAQAALRRQISELSMRHSSVQANVCKLSEGLEDVKSRASLMHSDLAEASQKRSELRQDAAAKIFAQQQLEAELEQQRDATMAWQACVDDLQQGHRAISSEAATAASVSRHLLGGSFRNSPARFEEDPAAQRKAETWPVTSMRSQADCWEPPTSWNTQRFPAPSSRFPSVVIGSASCREAEGAGRRLEEALSKFRTMKLASTGLREQWQTT